MWGTGLRSRFFFIIVTTLILGATGISWIQVYFFKNEKIRLIDEQIQQSTDALLSSEAFARSLSEQKDIDKAISDSIGGRRIGKVFVLKEADDRVVYQSDNLGFLNVNLPIDQSWITIQAQDQYVRVLNSKLEGGRILQVGRVMDQNFIAWKIFNLRMFVYITGIMLIVFAIAALLTLTLLSPTRLLNDYLIDATADLTNLRDVEPVPANLTRFTKGFWARSDEFAKLVAAIQKLIDRINLNYKLTRSWTLQMAHELKTPLAVIRAETETQRGRNLIPAFHAESLTAEVDRATEVINQFLDWAELENFQTQRELHALRMGIILSNAARRFEKIYPGRIRLNVESDFTVLANPVHLDQAVSNLLSNAFKFSDESTIVELTAKDHTVAVRDLGRGVPSEVLERLGEPFNIGAQADEPKQKGTGLGLAWVVTVARLYNWDFNLANTASGAEASIQFHGQV